MKTTDEAKREEEKNEVNQKVFGLLRFGDPCGNRTAVQGKKGVF